GPGGTQEVFHDMVGSCSNRYYYAVKFEDDVQQWSGLGSESYGAQTLCRDPDQPPCGDFVTQPGEPPLAGEPKRFEIVAGTPTTLRGPVDLRFSIPLALRGGIMALEVVDLSGRRVWHVADGRTGQRETTTRWDLRRSDGSRVPAGVYFLTGRLG